MFRRGNIFTGLLLKKTFGYLEGTSDFTLMVQPSNDQLAEYADADWAGSANCVSIAGNLIQLRGFSVY